MMCDLDHTDGYWEKRAEEYAKKYAQREEKRIPLSVRKEVNFLDMLFIQKINNMLNEKLKILQGNPGDIIYFKDHILYQLYQINRMAKGKLYYLNSNIPIDWTYVPSSILVNVFGQIKTNNFYVYRKLPGGNGHMTQYAKTWINDKRKKSVQ